MTQGWEQTWEQAYHQSMSFCHTVRWCSSPQKIDESWYRTFSCVAKSLGFNKAARRILWENLADGNWEHFHLTDEEEKRTADEWLNELCWDVRYCSDRWTLDRLTRCHWMFRQYMYAVQKEAGVEA